MLLAVLLVGMATACLAHTPTLKTCTTADNKAGKCVMYYHCNSYNRTETIISSPCLNRLRVCCLASEVLHSTPPPPTVPRHTGCGVRNPQGVGSPTKGVKDSQSQFGEFPWMVAIFKTDPAKVIRFKCGGSLIHPNVVMTTAHCALNDSLMIRAGAWDIENTNEIFPHQDRNIAGIAWHVDYSPAGQFNDIALLFLSEPVTLAEHVGVVCLPPQALDAPPARCFSSGWGKNLFGEVGLQAILKKVEMPIVERASCVSALKNTKLGKDFELHQTFICAGGEAGKGTCTGDGGSPLVCPMPDEPQRYMQSGIVDWGIGCGENLIPGVYVNVAKLRTWIDDQLSRYKLSVSYLTSS